MRLLWRTLAPVLLLAFVGAGAQSGSGTTAAALDPRGRELLEKSMRVMDGCFDERAALIRTLSPVGMDPSHTQWHLVRETSWYAAGLLLRNAAGDRERAIGAIDAVLKEQIEQPGARYHGTFSRYPEEARPTPEARMWRDYDPNWREFIGTTFQIILVHFGDRLPKDLAGRMEKSIRTAIEGEIQEGRLRPTYTNVALLFGSLIDFAGARFHRPDWCQRAAEWTGAVYREFKQYGAFTEFNSPTYYGTDLFGLALWRVHGSTAEVREAGGAMEAAVWRSIASMYHAGLKNMAGPYDRSYGMDMRRYASLTGLLLRSALDASDAPFPPVEYGVDHGCDIAYAPPFVLVPTRIPADAMEHFRAFQGERAVRQQITSSRIATAWLGKNHMLGGEETGKLGLGPQFHPATVHWKLPDGGVGWIRLLNFSRVDAAAARDTLTIACVDDAAFRILAAGAKAEDIQAKQWRLPGLTVQVETDATGASAKPVAGSIEIVYRGATRFTLKVQSAQ